MRPLLTAAIAVLAWTLIVTDANWRTASETMWREHVINERYNYPYFQALPRPEEGYTIQCGTKKNGYLALTARGKEEWFYGFGYFAEAPKPKCQP